VRSIVQTSQLIAPLFVVLGSVISGSLECSTHDDTKAQHGAELYARTCAVCHGDKGEGYKADDAPALSHPDFLASVTDPYLRQAITQGRQGTTMSAWGRVRGGPLAPSDVDDVIAHLRTWQTKRIKLDERPNNGDIVRGDAIFARECVRCHGLRGTGGPFEHIGDSELLSTAGNGFLRQAITHGREGTSMPAFDLTLGPNGIEDVLATMRHWQLAPTPATWERPPTPAPIPLGPVPLNPHGPEPVGFKPDPGTTPADVIHAQLARGAKMAILDARAPTDYTYEHIAGAVSVPFYDPDPYVDQLPRDAWLVAYCSCPHAESGQLARKLTAKGFTKVTVLDEGLGVWKNRKYPVKNGDKP
jgi:cytochrome c oxidase cbb3-type subunit 3